MCEAGLPGLLEACDEYLAPPPPFATVRLGATRSFQLGILLHIWTERVVVGARRSEEANAVKLWLFTLNRQPIPT